MINIRANKGIHDDDINKGRNTVRQIKAMMWKNFQLKRRMKGQLLWEVLLPIVFVFYVKYVLRNPCTGRDPPCNDDELQINTQISQIRNPILVAVVIPSIFSVGQRFIL